MAKPTVVYAVASSLDGYIAAEDGGVDWLHASMVKGESYDLDTFMRSIDGVLMGSRTYEKSLAMGGFTGSSTPCWVFSKRPIKAKKGITVTSAEPRDIVGQLATHGVTRAWLMGGGELAASFLEQGLIDEVSVGLMPVVLGAGIPVFGRLKNGYASLTLVESKPFKGGALGLRYTPVEAARSQPRMTRMARSARTAQL
jgi:dihydrofolate reductase